MTLAKFSIGVFAAVLLPVLAVIALTSAASPKAAIPATIVCKMDNQVATWTGRYREDHTSRAVIGDNGQIEQDIDIETMSCEYQHKHWNSIASQNEVHTVWQSCEVK